MSYSFQIFYKIIHIHTQGRIQKSDCGIFFFGGGGRVIIYAHRTKIINHRAHKALPKLVSPPPPKKNIKCLNMSFILFSFPPFFTSLFLSLWRGGGHVPPLPHTENAPVTYIIRILKYNITIIVKKANLNVHCTDYSVVHCMKCMLLKRILLSKQYILCIM